MPGLKFIHPLSDAGHDAQLLAKLGPMGMIFVPSIDRISHSPTELSTWSDCANGASLLLHTLLKFRGHNTNYASGPVGAMLRRLLGAEEYIVR